MGKFVHLHSHTQYSLLDGLAKIPELVKTVKRMGMDALAITDHGSMYGAIEFYKACKDAGIKPIIGVEMYVARRSYKDKEGKQDAEPYHLTVLAKNYQGYLNLTKLTTIAHVEGYYYKPRVDKKLLEEYHEGLIALSGCPSGEFIRSLEGEDIKESEKIIKSYLEIFGEGNFFFELQHHPYKDNLAKASEEVVKQDLERMVRIQEATWGAIKELSKKLGILVAATNDFHYAHKDDAEAQDALLCVQTGKLISDVDRLRMIDTPDYYVKSSEEMEEDFHEFPAALGTTVKIANMCNLELSLGKPKFPIFDLPEGKSSAPYLREKVFEGAGKRMEMTEERTERLEYELSVIEKKGYTTYFLIVQDFMNWATEQGIITNTRGSAAGSLVLYALGVTDIDPIFYILPFERFLNPFRPSLPDIDCDMADDRRDEVIRYVMEKYGEDKVAHIITFGTMMGRAAIRDVGRVMGISYGEVDRIAKLVPPPQQGFHKPLGEAIKEVPDLTELYKNSPQYKKLLDLAIKVEGTVRHASVHAAGIVIGPEPLINVTPLQKESNGDKVVTQYDMFSVEEVGLVKMDFLGIRNLSILGKAVEYVKQNQAVAVDLKNIPLDDSKAYELLARGETMGLFQLEGSGMTKYLTELKPTNIFDISAMVALYRPGPLSIIPEYIARKHHPERITYFDPRMKSFLERSLGLLVYQDDVLLTAINIAGYTWEEADKFRKAMGKKIPAEMAKQKDHFVQGCVENGMSQEKAEGLFSLIEPFAKYGFNKAHAASYALVAYQTAYMKANFPVEFMAAVMTAESGDTEKIAQAIEECKQLSINVLPPDVNKSGVGFTIEPLDNLSQQELAKSLTVVGVKGEKEARGVRFGLSAIKNVGVLAIESIVKARQKGPFKDLRDLCLKVDTRLVNKKTLESLIKAGALDNFGSRAAQLLVLDQCLEESHKATKDRLSGQVSLFGAVEEAVTSSLQLPNIEEMPLEQLLTFEKDLLGFYIHEPPYLALLQKVARYTSCGIGGLTEDQIGKKVVVGGVVVEVKKVLTKRDGQEMAFLKISDGVNGADLVVFPKTFADCKEFLIKDKVVVVWGKLDKREEELSLVVDKIVLFDPENIQELPQLTFPKEVIEIYVPLGTGIETLRSINKLLRNYPGPLGVTLYLQNGSNELKRMPLPFSIAPSADLEEKIKELLGAGSFKKVVQNLGTGASG